jgi:hypothetical protein
VALASRGITVNAISPGVTEDSILNILPPPTRRAGPDTLLAAGWTSMGRLGTPADIGNAVALLSSEEAGWITGWGIAHEPRFPARDSAQLAVRLQHFEDRGAGPVVDHAVLDGPLGHADGVGAVVGVAGDAGNPFPFIPILKL